jgi:hypothetical protein
MTTKNRAIRNRGMMGNIQAGGVVINSHRSTSCGLAAVAQETEQTNTHFNSLHRERAFCNPFSTAADAGWIQQVRAVRQIFWKNLPPPPGCGGNWARHPVRGQFWDNAAHSACGGMACERKPVVPEFETAGKKTLEREGCAHDRLT